MNSFRNHEKSRILDRVSQSQVKTPISLNNEFSNLWRLRDILKKRCWGYFRKYVILTENHLFEYKAIAFGKFCETGYTAPLILLSFQSQGNLGTEKSVLAFKYQFCQKRAVWQVSVWDSRSGRIHGVLATLVSKPLSIFRLKDNLLLVDSRSRLDFQS